MHSTSDIYNPWSIASFIDNDGNELSQEFTDDFTEENQILIAVQYSDNEWSIAYDK